MLILALLTFSLIKGVHAVITKTIQQNYVNGFNESVYLTVLYSSFQFVFLLLMPPYYNLNFSKEMLINPIFFAVFAMTGFIMYLAALSKGPTSLTNIIINFMMLVPIIAGLLIWDEVIKPLQVIGLLLVILIIFLFNQSSYNEGNINKPITPKWLLLAIGSAVFSGLSVIFTKQHAIQFSAALKEYLFLLNLITFIIGFPYTIWALMKKKIKLNFNKKFLLLVAATAVIQNVSNIIYTFYAGKLNSALFFPLMSILSIISVVLMSRLVLKEKASRKAYIGIGLSLLAIYFLSY